ncbi:Monooxygenase [Madurella fahalii]|uniref:Monooxygenase n=1 Tax=Madurella fahalii TaxID=1157608 RepID=A0ABQ0GJZ7_9PEZI
MDGYSDIASQPAISTLEFIVTEMSAKLQHIGAAAPTPARHNHAEAVKITRYSAFRDNFRLTTWIALGALLQGLASLLLPARYALLPALYLLLHRAVRAIMMAGGVIPNTQMDGVIMGKYTAQIPRKDGSLPTQPAEEEIAVILLAARSNHPLGLFGKGYRDISDMINGMLAELWENGKEKYGFLGQTSYIAANERHTNNQVLVLCYFRSIEGLHAFAHSPIHRKAWDWWNSVTKSYPYLSIMHEVYHAPKGHWENIYGNNHITGIAKTNALVTIDGQPARPLFDANRGSLRTQLGRLGRGDGAENEKYGPSPY